MTDNWVSCHIFRIKRWFYTKNMNFHCSGVKLKAGGGGSSHSPPRGYFWWVQVAFWQLRRRRLSLTAHGRCVPLRGVQRPNSLEYQTSTPLPFDTLVTGLPSGAYKTATGRYPSYPTTYSFECSIFNYDKKGYKDRHKDRYKERHKYRHKDRNKDRHKDTKTDKRPLNGDLKQIQAQRHKDTGTQK